MPNILDANGLQVKSVTEITTDLTTAYQQIYGADINVGSNSPDGQTIGILAQLAHDILELLTQVYNSFSIDSAFGVTLDSRIAMSGIQRQQGTYTLAQVNVTVSQALSILGQNELVANPNITVFTVQDNSGNQYELVTTHAFGAAGTATLTFVSAVIGQIQTTANTIQTITTIQTGVSSVNNPTTASDIEGLPEETDIQVKIRRAKSFYLQAVGPSDSLRAALLNVEDISDAYVAENNTSGSVDGIPAYSIWVITSGGTDPEIANVIYTKKAPGCGMAGNKTYNITRPQGNIFRAYWDVSIPQSLTLRATLIPKISGQTFDLVSDADQLASALVYKLGQSPSIGDVVIAMQAIEPNAILTSINVSKNGGATWQDVVSPDSFKYYFIVTSVNIILT